MKGVLPVRGLARHVTRETSSDRCPTHTGGCGHCRCGLDCSTMNSCVVWAEFVVIGMGLGHVTFPPSTRELVLEECVERCCLGDQLTFSLPLSLDEPVHVM